MNINKALMQHPVLAMCIADLDPDHTFFQIISGRIKGEEAFMRLPYVVLDIFDNDTQEDITFKLELLKDWYFRQSEAPCGIIDFLADFLADVDPNEEHEFTKLVTSDVVNYATNQQGAALAS